MIEKININGVEYYVTPVADGATPTGVAVTVDGVVYQLGEPVVATAAASSATQTIEKVQVNGVVYDIADVEAVEAEAQRAQEAERELRGEQQKLSGIAEGLATELSGIAGNVNTLRQKVDNTSSAFGTFIARPNTEDVTVTYSNVAGNAGLFSIPAATTEKAGMMSAEDKSEQVKKTPLVNGDVIVGQAREIYSLQGRISHASFVRRPTGGGTTINSGAARLRQLGGSVLRNLVDGSFESGWSITNGEFEVNDGVVKVTSLAGVMRLSGAKTQNYVEVSGHLYYTRCNVYCTAATGGLVLFDYSNDAGSTSVSPAVVSGQQWETVSTRYKSNASEFYRGCCIVDKREEKNGVIYACNPLYIDLTEMFGAGNEPTKDECDEMFSAVGTLPKGFTEATPKYLKSVGYNQCDTSKAVVGKTVSDGTITDGANILVSMPCLPCKRGTGENNGYCIGHGDGDAWSSDNIVAVYYTPVNPYGNTGYLYTCALPATSCTQCNGAHDVYVPACAGWLLIETTTTDKLCAHFAWSGDRAHTDYEPYSESSIALPEIPQMSEWGLAGVKGYNDVIDYTKDEYVKAVNRVVLNGTENWGKRPNNMGFFNTSLLSGNSAKTNCAMVDADVKLVVQISTNSYGTIAVDNNSIYVNYSETVNAMTVEEFKQYLAAHPITIYYALATPENHPIVERTTPAYIADDYGVEGFDGTTVPIQGAILFYQRSLVHESRNYIDTLLSKLATSDVKIAATRIAAAVLKVESMESIEEAEA